MEGAEAMTPSSRVCRARAPTRSARCTGRAGSPCWRNSRLSTRARARRRSAGPYWALAEELDLTVGIHMGPGPPGAAYGAMPKYRMALSSALLLEEVFVRHPRLRVYFMHAGWPMLDDMLGLLWARTRRSTWTSASSTGRSRAPSSTRTCGASSRPAT